MNNRILNIKKCRLLIVTFTLLYTIVYSQTPSVSSNRFKRIDYEYDLISGKVNEVDYQKGQADAFHHHYEYDSDNRITEVYTSKFPNAIWTGNQDDPFWEREAKYFYYAHGSLARVEYGSNNVQGVDYAHTLQGWIKGVNSNTLKTNRDMGKDGDASIPNANGLFAKDAFGYTLNYYKGDYKAIDGLKWNNANDRFEAVTTGSDLMNSRNDLYNGNITSMVTTIVKPTLTETGDTLQFVPLPQGTAYRYDQLNRLKEMKAWQNLNVTSNAWGTGLAYNGMYNNKFTYDANGSMLTALAKNQSGQIIDNQTYYHQTIAGKKYRNRTYAITDAATQTSGNDLLNQMAFNNTATTINNINNYSYTEIGERKSNKQDSIDLITWTAYGKIKEVKRSNGCSKYNLKFDYDGNSNRVAKHVYKSDGTTWIHSEYYIKDAQGNIISTYYYEVTGVTPPISYAQTEKHIYGINSVGIDETKTEMLAVIIDSSHYINTLGKKLFNGSNHLGNVLVTFTDRKLQVDLNGDNIVDEYWPHVISSNDYAPFGGLLTERTFKKGSFPNSFNGKRDDAELGNWQDYGMRMFSPWEREFSTIDPIASDFPHLTPYQFSTNSPISGIDLDGLEFFYAANGTYLGKIGTSTQVRVLDEKKLKIDAAKTLIKLANNFKVTSKGAEPYLDKFSNSLGVNHDVFLAFGSLVDNESGGNKDESFAIANVTMNFINEGGSSSLKTIEDVSMYDNSFAQGAKEATYQAYVKKSPQERNAKYAIAAVINALGRKKGIAGFSDNTNGADSWDGIDLIATSWENDHRDYSWSEDSKALLKKYQTKNKGGVDTDKFTFKKKGFEITAKKIIGKTIFTNLAGGRGEGKESTTKFKTK